MLIHLALLLTLLEILALSGVLLLWARQVAGARLLVVFLLGVAIWVIGNELPNWAGLGSVPLAMALLSSLSLTSAAFLHFCVIFCGAPVRRGWIVAAYAAGLLVALLSLWRSPGDFIQAMLMLLGLLVVSLTVLLPVESKWLNALAVAAACLLLRGPVWAFAARLVYPGGIPSPQDLRSWRQTLGQAQTPEQLGAQAAQLVSARLGTPVQVQVQSGNPGMTEAVDAPAPMQPALLSTPAAHEPGAWHTQLLAFDEAPPGQRHLAELFGEVLADAAAGLQRAQLAQQQERERQLQARLAELGSLAATVAHDVRNPLNIIAMAVALAPPDTRHEVNAQIARISHLTEDLLDYAKPWRIAPVACDVHQRIRALLAHHPQVEQAEALAQPHILVLDPARFDQALGNLIANACTAAGSRRVRVETETQAGQFLVHVCDDGPGVAPDMRERLFEPFASRSPGGTGLGLAIVARIMAAHGGAAVLSERAPWRTCLTLQFPAEPSKSLAVTPDTAMHNTSTPATP